MKTLYVSDLDGTLLRSDQHTSEYTNRVINELVGQGLCLSYATARSYVTARKVTSGMTASFPLIVYNGAFMLDNRSGKRLAENYFDPDESLSILQALMRASVFPILYAIIDGQERFTYLEQQINAATRAFCETRRGDSRALPVTALRDFLRGHHFYITCIDQPEKLEPFYLTYKDRYHCVYQKDIYSGEQWLEIMPRAASKANAARQLAIHLGCNRIVAFGDGKNDIDLFQNADECYAVENAVEELKVIATAVIGSNNDDAVARWLQANAVFHQL